MLKALLVVALCLPGLVQAQAPKKSAEEVWNDLFAKREGDVDKFDYGRNKWDLVVGMYMHEYLTRNAAKVIDSLKPGGILVIEGIHRDINTANLAGERYGYRTNELPKLFSRLRVIYYEDTTGLADWDRSGGKPVPIVRMVAVKEAAAGK